MDKEKKIYLELNISSQGPQSWNSKDAHMSFQEWNQHRRMAGSHGELRVRIISIMGASMA